ncbi:MAG: condensation domain-containing protein, partial [Candidatus Methylomirabilales bacterium]
MHEGCLSLTWSYCQQRHRRASIEALARRYLDALGALIEHCCSPEAGGLTPSDVPLARLDQAALDRLAGAGGLEDVYPLTPMQQGLAFESLYAPETTVYREQLVLALQGPLDRAALKEAWRVVVARHPALRARVALSGLERPLALVEAEMELVWEERDFRGLDAPERRLEELLLADRARGFELEGGRLLRLCLIRLGEADHRLVMSCHHLLLDGWSGAIVLEEVRTCYEARCRGQEPRLPSPRPYRDYLAWLEAQDPEAAEAYWRRALQGIEGPTPLGIARSSPEQESQGSGVVGRELDASSTAALGELARRHRITLNTVVEGAWALLLSRYCGESDVVFGTTVSGRSAPVAGIESMVGLLINTIPTRVRISPQAKVADWLCELQDRQAEARHFEHTPLVAIQGWAGLRGGQALFETLLVFENYPVAAGLRTSEWAGLQVHPVSGTEQTNYPLSVSATSGASLSLRISYDRARFDAETIEALANHFTTLLEAIAADPERPISALSLLSEAERHRVLLDYNDTAASYPDDACIHQLFEAQAASSPEALAVVFEEQALTYAALDAQANRLAHHLASLGVGPEMVVGICLERSLDLVVGLLGILKAGGAYLPLDPDYPSQRLAFMLADAKAPILVTHTRLAERLPAPEAQVVCLDADREAIATHPTAAPPTTVGSDNLAYVIYTSGSTGEPKGAMIPHGALANYASALRAAVYGTRCVPLRVSLNARVAFDASVKQLSHLLWGDCLEIVPDAVRLDAEALVAFARERLDVLDCSPSQLKLLLKAGLPVDGSRPSVVLIGGEAIEEATWRELASCSGSRFYNHYGPTECTVNTTISRICRERPRLGRPVANMRVYLLDAGRQPVPMGVPGEVCIGGAGVGLGYLGDPRRTAERFVPDPFSPQPGG